MLKPQKLKNGITLIKLPKNTTNFMTVGFVIRSGSCNEFGNFPQGITQLVEKLFWRGTYKHQSTKELNLALEEMGGEYWSESTQELLQFWIKVPVYNQYKAVSFLSEIIQRSFFDARAIELEKKLLIEKIKQNSGDVARELSEVNLESIYPNSPIGKPVMGSVESITQINPVQVIDYLAHQFQPDKCFLVVSGNYESKRVVDLLEQEWSMWNPKLKKFHNPKELLDEENIIEVNFPQIAYRQRGISRTLMSVSFVLDEGLTPNFELMNLEEDQCVENQLEASLNKKNITKTVDKNAGKFVDKTDEKTQAQLQLKFDKYLEQRQKAMAVLMLLNTIIGAGYSSRLYAKGVEEEQLFGNIESELKYFETKSFLKISGDTENLQFSFGLESIFSTLESLKKTTISINELSKAKEVLRSKLLESQESLMESSIFECGQYILSGGYPMVTSDIIDKISAIEASQIRSLALDLFIPSRLCIATLGTTKENRLVEKLIRKYLD